MTVQQFLTNIAIILAVMAIGALIETAVPMFVAKPWTHPRRSANLGLTVVAFLLNWLLASVAATAVLLTMPFEGPAAVALPDTKVRLEVGAGR